MGENVVQINRGPVLTLWAAAVAERMGFQEDEALTLGKAVAGLNAQAKGRRLGIFRPAVEGGGRQARKEKGLGEDFWIEVCGRAVPAKNTEDGVRAVVKDKPVEPARVRKYLGGKFGDALEDVWAAMRELAESFAPEDLEEESYGLYEKFRPQIAAGRRGWGQKGDLDLDFIRSLGG